MPYVSISTIKGILNPEQKLALHQRIADLMVEIEGRGNPEFRRVVWVKIDEQEPAQWSMGGHVYSAEQIARLRGPDGADGWRPAQGES
ncbi:tautomerase family protein [Bradyrhizobium manausense]|uniref:tautomerase family protein n=1 Tax=Bradyrhizobium TaxID=374 RepID=UPI001BA73DE4|nr:MULTISPECIES: tautomerase family protein [Bradyrhizobium]MBR0826610.1 tautomerase family protein [Bradyrhizobium manausense]UVO28999.1 tautomerase family protein [Bradyrhizobium arachidis]